MPKSPAAAIQPVSDLSPLHWVQAALDALVQAGIEAVRVERLAARLGVTKGSFYWHFKDRPALLAAVLDYWQSEFTSGLIVDVAHLRTPQARLRAMADAALAPTIAGIDNARAEMAMQAWAAKDASVALRLRAIDATRLDYLGGELGELGFSPDRAQVLARALYQALLGVYAARAYNPDIADNAAYRALLELVLADSRWNR